MTGQVSGAPSAVESSGCWPTREQVWLLRAALAPDDAALAAWRSWCAAVGPAAADRASRRLLPLVAHNLHRLGARDAELEPLRRLHAQVWAHNRVRFARLAVVLRALADAGIETLALKGAALAAHVYEDPGLRPMSDLDIAVPTEKALQAVALLAGQGWCVEGRPDLALQVTHAIACAHAHAGQLDLHWHVLAQCRAPGADDAFWQGAARVTIGGADTRILCPTDQLLHVLAHGLRWCPLPPFRWAADATVLLRRSSAAIDWDRLEREAADRRLTLTLREGLAWLARTLDAPVPPAVLERLAAQRLSRFERAEFRVTTRPWGRAGALPVHLFLNARTSDSLIASLLRLPGYLQKLYGAERLWQLPAALFARRGARARARRHLAPAGSARQP